MKSKVSTSAGTVIGQLGFGYLADVVGRKKMYGLELILIIFSTVAQALSSDSPGMSIVGTIIFWRVLMGSKYHMRNIRSKTELTHRQLVLVVTTLSSPSSHPNSQPPSGAAP